MFGFFEKPKAEKRNEVRANEDVLIRQDGDARGLTPLVEKVVETKGIQYEGGIDPVGLTPGYPSHNDLRGISETVESINPAEIEPLIDQQLELDALNTTLANLKQEFEVADEAQKEVLQQQIDLIEEEIVDLKNQYEAEA